MTSTENLNTLHGQEFSVRIIVCDYYVTKPIPGTDVIYSEFRGSDIKQVPVLRIFGPATDGHKTCLHIHGVFPYFYIPCPMSNPEPQFLYQIATSLDKALNIALKQATSTNQHVYKISLVKGLPFYGYHDKEHLYLKIFLYNPGLVKQAVELCSNGAILGQILQPHESHLNFTLQFFIDFNLFGMSNIDIETLKFRRKPTKSQNSCDPLDDLYDNSIKAESICHFEADCVASHIINRQRIGRGDGIENPGLEEVWNQELERRKQLNMSMASKSLSQGRFNDETESHYKFEQMFWVKMANLNDRPQEGTKEEQTVYYPAESLEGSQLFDAMNVSTHDSTIKLNSIKLSQNLNDTLFEDIDTTIVNESVALNCSLPVHRSQVVLDNEDMDLFDMLKDMDEETVEKDSILGTPSNVEGDELSDGGSEDAEYSQIFNEATVIETNLSNESRSESQIWNDSFWEGANIPQLDGTCDDEHTKKVRKRKMRPFKLGLSRPKPTKNIKRNACLSSDMNEEKNADVCDGTSIDTEMVVAKEPCIDKKGKDSFNGISQTLQLDSKPEIVDNVNVNTNDNINNVINKIDVSKNYDLLQNYEPKAGPSNGCAKLEKSIVNDSESDCDNDLGIQSFYDTSKIFNVSLDNSDPIPPRIIKMEETSFVNSQSSSNCSMKLYLSEDNEVEKQPEISSNKTVILTPKIRPPTRDYIISTLQQYGIPKVKNLQPFYSDYKDVGDKVEIGQMVLKLQSNIAQHQKPFDNALNTFSIEEWRNIFFTQNNENGGDLNNDTLKCLLASNRQCVLEPIVKPPKTSDVLKWLESKERVSEKQDGCGVDAENEITEIHDDLENSQALGLNEDVIDCSVNSENDKDKTDVNKSLQVTMQTDGSYLCYGSGGSTQKELNSPTLEVDFLTVMVLETHTAIRGTLNPDPAYDEIQAVFMTITNDCPPDDSLQRSVTEIFVVDGPLSSLKKFDRCIFNIPIVYVNNEIDLLGKVIETIQLHDPDIVCGYEIEMTSWGYILERAQVLGVEMLTEISRITERHRQKRWRSDERDYEGRILGRVIFNVWRLLRYELALTSYSFENCMLQVLNERVPKYSFAQLAEWWNCESRITRWLPVEYYLTRLSGTVRMMEKLDIIKRTSELARLFGLQWWEVLSRGSQFRVESLMLRAARPLNLVALSPTVKQRAAMKAPECLPLIFEPESRFYADPVIVLDFQSLYPSMMIAYNYCFSTCIGRVQNINGQARLITLAINAPREPGTLAGEWCDQPWDQAYEFGAWRLRIPKAKLEALVKKGFVHWSPVGVGFVRPEVRRGVLPALLRRILAARQAVKKSMKAQTDDAVRKALHSRQLGLKLIANVTYGYTAANFSGRMPCVEVGDSVVAKGRETLERAVKLVKDNPNWNAKVVYGDTDSMFVVVPGGTRAEAFTIGQQIADAVTADNPSPVALKLEKVYQPCILQTKKRYVGYMYESADQATPVYEAKGIETVRRDGCPAGVKLLQRSLCELFDSGDVSRVKRLVTATLARLADGRVPLHELLFTREYNGPAGYRPGAAAPPAEIAKRLSAKDRRSVPRTGERVSWLVCAGAPGLPLIRLARTPAELRRDPSLKPHVCYYATRAVLPPLHRCFSLLGVNVFKWWNDLGYTREAGLAAYASTGGAGIARYLWRERCVVCKARSQRSVCGACSDRPQRAVFAIASELRDATEHVRICAEICASCSGHTQSLSCENLECPVLWRRQRADQKFHHVQDTVKLLPSHMKSLDF